MRMMCLLIAATALAGCAAPPEPPEPEPLIRCIAIPNGLAECSELPGPTLPRRSAG